MSTLTQETLRTPWTPGARSLALGLIGALGVTAYLFGITGMFAVSEAQTFRPIALTAAGPVALFLAAYGLSERFRGFVLAQDLVTLTNLQLWRVLGFTFLMLYAHDVLPALFAWPAGFGDIAIGFAAPFVAARLVNDPAFAASRRFVIFHALGLLDFAVAVAAASLASGAYPALVEDGLTSGPMEVWPLNLFPSFFVPLFIIVHLTVLLKVRALRRVHAVT